MAGSLAHAEAARIAESPVQRSQHNLFAPTFRSNFPALSVRAPHISLTPAPSLTPKSVRTAQNGPISAPNCHFNTCPCRPDVPKVCSSVPDTIHPYCPDFPQCCSNVLSRTCPCRPDLPETPKPCITGLRGQRAFGANSCPAVVLVVGRLRLPNWAVWRDWWKSGLVSSTDGGP